MTLVESKECPFQNNKISPDYPIDLTVKIEISDKDGASNYGGGDLEEEEIDVVELKEPNNILFEQKEFNKYSKTPDVQCPQPMLPLFLPNPYFMSGKPSVPLPLNSYSPISKHVLHNQVLRSNNGRPINLLGSGATPPIILPTPVDMSASNPHKRKQIRLENTPLQSIGGKKSRPYKKVDDEKPTMSQVAETSGKNASSDKEKYEVIRIDNLATTEAKSELAKIPNKIGPYICQLCKILFNDAFLLAQHKCCKIAHIEYKCPECNKVFNCPANLASHRRWHKPRLIQPSVKKESVRLNATPLSQQQKEAKTNANTRQRTNQERASVSDDGGTEFNCIKCSKQFPGPRFLRAHLDEHMHDDRIAWVDDDRMLAMSHREFTSRPLNPLSYKLNNFLDRKEGLRPFNIFQTANEIYFPSTVSRFPFSDTPVGLYPSPGNMFCPGEPVRCPLCGFMFPDNLMLDSHIKLHHNRPNNFSEFFSSAAPLPVIPPTYCPTLSIG